MSKTVLLMLLITLALSAMVNVAMPQSDDQEDFNRMFGKKYEKSSPEQQAYRLTVFKQNADEVRAHNSDKSRTYDKGINFLSDLTSEEFVKIYLGLKVPSNLVPTNTNPQRIVKSGIVTFNPINWNNVITSVKNQGICNSCWAFSTLAAIESAYKRKPKATDYDLSEQELVECVKDRNSKYFGCGFGWFEDALKYVKANKVNTEKIYPYKTATLTDGLAGACRNIRGSISIKSYVNHYSTSCPKLVLNLANYGPVAVAVDSTHWKTYSNGVFNNCGASSVNHGVLLVGASNAEWRIKNSWGITWGEAGFMRLLGPNQCSYICHYHNSVTV